MAADLPVRKGAARGGEARRRLPARRAGILLAVFAAAGLLLAAMVVVVGRDPGVLQSTLIDRPAPGVAGATLDGDRFDLTSLAGKVTIVNFWASWCTECRREHPEFVRVAERYRNEPVALVGVIFQDDPGAARRYMQEMGGDWPNVIDPDGRIAIDYGVYGVPETFLVDAAGKVRAKAIGRIDERMLRSWIDSALATAAVP